MTGVVGFLLAAQVGVPRAITFQTQDSPTLGATALIGGIQPVGAVIAGIFNRDYRSSFRRSGAEPELPPIIFGAGLLEGMLDGSGRSVDQFPKDVASLYDSIFSGVRTRRAHAGGATIEVTGLIRPFAAMIVHRRRPPPSCGDPA